MDALLGTVGKTRDRRGCTLSSIVHVSNGPRIDLPTIHSFKVPPAYIRSIRNVPLPPRDVKALHNTVSELRGVCVRCRALSAHAIAERRYH